MKFSSLSSKCFIVVAGLFATALYFCGQPVQAVNVLTQHNDNSRTGANTSETTLTIASVSGTNFGPLFTNSVDGQVYAQPLYVQNLAISGGTHNVLFIATENSTVYAFDADTGGTIYWTNHLGTALTSGCGDTSPKVGITGTPVIDLTLGALYVDTRVGATSGHKFHAVNITNGNEMFGGPVDVTNIGTSEHQRPGLLEVSNVVYVAYGSQCDAGTYHGFVIGFSATNLAQLYNWNESPNGSQGAIWDSGMGPVADASGNIYVISGNGTYDGSTNNDYGMSMVKLSSHLAVLDWATPSDYANLSGLDQDFGSGGGVLLPGGRLIGEGKDGIVHVVDTSNLGHLNNFKQSFAGPNGGDVVGPSPVYWAGSGTNFIYYEHGNTSIYWYSDNGTTVNTTPLGSNTVSEADSGGGISLSANGTTNGILWTLDTDGDIRAYDAQHFPTVLWSASVGSHQKMNCPTIANGKVYAPTPSGVIAYGLKSGAPAITSQPSSQTKYTGQTATFTVGASGSSPLVYQWKVQSSGSYVNLSNGGQFSGVTNTTLTISSLALTNATNYEVVVTNSLGSVTSSAALLTVSNLDYQGVVLNDSPAAYWPMQETNGPTIHDIVSTNNGTLVTSKDSNIGLGYHTNFATAGSGATDGKTYLIGGTGGLGVSGDKAIYFTNLNTSVSNSQIVVPYNAAIDPSSALTAEAWINIPTYPIGYTNTTFQTALGLEAFGGAINGWWIGANTDSSGSQGDVEFNLAEAPGSAWATSTATSSLAGNWVYVVEVYSSSTLTCYTNGGLMGTVAMGTNYESEGVYGTHKLPFIIGSYSSPGGASGGYNGGGTLANGFERGNFWHGGISHVAIYTTALTTTQITNHYHFGTNGATGTAPSITSQPASTTNYATQTATFSVTASGSPTLAYQWKVLSSGSYVNLSNVGQYSGVTTATLTISNLAATNATNYEVVVTNAFGTATSAAATLTVVPAAPSITTQPSSTTKSVGQTATFTVVAAGLPPLSYQWKVQSSGVYGNLANTGQFSGVTTATLTISNVALTNATNYEVVVTNTAGTVTSAAALLTVNASANYQSIILADAPVSYWPMQETTGPTISDIVTTNAGPFNGTMQVSTDGVTNGGTDGEGKVWGIIHETFTNVTSTAATDGATYLFGGAGGLAGVTNDKAVYFTNLNGQLNCAQIAMGTNGTGAYEAQLDASNFTIEAWIKVPTYTIGWTSNDYQIPLGLNAFGNAGGTANGWFMGVKTDNSGSTAYGEMFFDAGTGTAFTSNGPSAQVFSGHWVYAVQEYNGTATVIYTNGTLMVSNAQSYQPLSHSPTHEEPLIIGSETAYYFSGSAFSGNTRADFWHGGVSHVAYYNYALAASHITNHYYYGTNASFAGSFKAPVAPAFKPTVGATLTPALSSGSSAKQFQMQVSAVANQNYTLQICTDLSSGNWVSLYTTNSTTNTSFVLTDPSAATNKQRFYRVLIGP